MPSNDLFQRYADESRWERMDAARLSHLDGREVDANGFAERHQPAPEPPQDLDDASECWWDDEIEREA